MAAQTAEFQPFNNQPISRPESTEVNGHDIREVAWQCPGCSHNSLAGGAVKAADFNANTYVGNDEFCPNCAQPFEGKAEQYFLGPLSTPKVDHWIDGEPA